MFEYKNDRINPQSILYWAFLWDIDLWDILDWGYYPYWSNK